ncbi:ABC transporter substrate-binding protein [Spirochaeta cellobiosiphila]|uniref:ABC transporter substrate-binding protein n=1 Tax=Spirochaeta cellobiosiphila TaxID=504483 RepID=UPI0004086563|nr:ABC transporter substrate-binding protein [Spirochaeta cellobiosiphila]
MKRLATILLNILIVSSFAMANGQQQKSTSTGKSGGVLVFARSGDSVGLDPARETDGESFYATGNIFDTLVEFKPGTTEVQPALAKSWDISDDGLTFTFHLVEGAMFHDGTPVNAKAVKFSFDRQFVKSNPYYKLGPWKYWGYMDMDSIVSEVIAKDDTTVIFKLKKVEAPFLANLAMDFAAIVSPTALEKYGTDFASNPVGSGPFKFVSWQKDDNIILERNESYWRRPAYLDRLVLKVIPDATARYLALQKGEVDVVDFPSVEDLADIESNPDIKLISQAGMNVGYLALNNEKKPFDNVKVRQAINFAINKKEIIAGVYGEAGTAAKNPLPPNMWSYNDDITPYEYSPEKAKKLLAEAGYPDGFSTTLWAMPVARPYNPNGRKVAEIMQAQLAKVGIQVEIVSYEWGTYLDKTDQGEHDMALMGWTGDNGDPDNFLWVLLSAPAAVKPAGNIAFWKNDEFTSVIKQAKETFDIEKRTELYKEAQVIFHNQAPWVPLAHSVVYAPVKKSVMDYVLYPTGSRKFYNVYFQ